MNTYQRFIFKDYKFNVDSGTLHLYYSFDGIVEFSESYHFDFDFVPYDELALDRAVQDLFFMAGVFYYKAYVPPAIAIEKGELDSKRAAFFRKTYERGLGEFFYVNHLDPKTPVIF